MKITRIKKLKNTYKITLEDNRVIETYDEIIINNNILYKKEITEELEELIKKQNEYYEIYNKIIKYIKIKLRSEYEIKEYMEKQNVDEKTQSEIIKKLKDGNLINNEKYVYAYIHDKLKFTNDGPNKIKKELIKQKINEELIDEQIDKIDKKEIKDKLEKLIIKKLKSNNKYSNNMIKIKLINYFLNMGYEKEIIIDILEKNKQQDNEIIKKEYEKLYKKLNTKYDNYELTRIIKQKLYQKGFNIDEINEVLK